MADESIKAATVQIQNLTLGDRFISGGILWTLTGFDDDYCVARRHSAESRFLGIRGYGYHGDAICSFPKKERVVFVPVADDENRDLRERLAVKIQDAVDVHIKMVTAYAVSGMTVHGCEMCDALNAIYRTLQEKL